MTEVRDDDFAVITQRRYGGGIVKLTMLTTLTNELGLGKLFRVIEVFLLSHSVLHTASS